MVDTSKPRLFLWELVSFANEWGMLGDLDSKGYDDSVRIGLPPTSKWRIWTRQDQRRGRMPEGVAPDRFYLKTGLRSRNPLGDYTSWGERAIQVVSDRFAKLLEEMGQTDYQLFPLTMWWRPPGEPHSEKAPPADLTETFQALHCWKDAEIFDLERSNLNVTSLIQYSTDLSRDEFDAPEDDVPTTIVGSWERLAVREGVKPVLPPMYRIPSVGGVLVSRYVSPQMKDEIERRKLKVKFARRYIDYEYEARLIEASHAGIKFERPEEFPLGC